MFISGKIQSVVYRNEDNNYSVVKISSGGEVLTCVGKFPSANVGERVEIDGTITKNEKYGEQISVNTIKILPPNDEEGIIKYLSSSLFKGIGPTTAKKIVDRFGKDTLTILDLNPLQLAEVKGISKEKALGYAVCYREAKEYEKTIMFLANYNIGTNLAIKIHNKYLDQTEQVLKTNPYKLVEDIDGIGFMSADKIAQKIGLPANSIFRFRAGLLYALKQNSERSGNTYIKKQDLIEQVLELLKVQEEDGLDKIDTVLSQFATECIVKEFVQDDEQCVMLTSLYFMEQSVAQKLLRLKNEYEKTPLDISLDIADYELSNGIKLHQHQREAVEIAVNNGVSVITGGPGTGKTTIVKCVLTCLKKQGKKCILLAPTGRASKRLSDSTGEEASTIHRALDLDFKNGEGIFFAKNEQNPLPYDVVIVDEVSMVDSQLMFNLLKAIKHNAQLILVGDKDQLPSVGAGNVLSDILQSGVIEVKELTEIYRQDAQSYIITNAHAINDGKMPKLDNSSKDFFFENKPDATEMLHTIISLVTIRLPHYMKTEASKIQVLAPLKAGICGVDNLNKELQKMINPAKPNSLEIQTECVIYRTGDKVMQTVNNYEQTWERMTKEGYMEYGQGVFNGDSGVIESISVHTGEITVLFEDGRRAIYARENIFELMLSYAITIHKSQGSEFDIVVIPVISGSGMILTRNLLYTAVTRAKKMVVLVGTKQNIARMVHNNYTIKRYSMLKQFLITEQEKYKLLFE
ncbi:MAG: ATP-dependent RecD-like DNA helicase [Clostridia bacterium]|nr:ATP-dependent RecD-like DNA helicase [Clostridia bacterium]